MFQALVLRALGFGSRVCTICCKGCMAARVGEQLA